MTPFRPEQSFFADPAIDRVLAVTMALAAEVFVLRRQVRRLTEAESTPDEAADADDFVRHLLQAALGEQPAQGHT